MSQEEKDLLVKDLCSRLPYGVKCRQFKLNSQTCTLTADLLDKVDNLEPYLRPMSSMTEEEGNELLQLMGRGTDIERIDFYLSHHFDYRGLIPMGLALEAPEGMYNI